jgi:hypothetical protein
MRYLEEQFRCHDRGGGRGRGLLRGSRKSGHEEAIRDAASHGRKSDWAATVPRRSLSAAYGRFHPQSLVFRVAAQLVNGLGKPWLFPQAVRIVGEAVDRKVEFAGGVDPRELCNLRYVTQLRERLAEALRPTIEGDRRLLPVLDQYQPIGSTDRIAFSTGKPCEPTIKSACGQGAHPLRGPRRLDRGQHDRTLGPRDLADGDPEAKTQEGCRIPGPLEG